MPTNSGGIAAKNVGQTGRKQANTAPGVTTRASGSKEYIPKVQTAEDAREWLLDMGALLEAEDPVDADVLKAALLMLTARKDVTQEVKEGLRAIAIGMEEVRAGEAERMVLETVGRAMEEYREVMENMADATVKTVKGMADQTKELVERVEEGQVVEAKPRQVGIQGTARGAEEPTTAKMDYAQAARRAEQEDIVKRAKDRSRQMIIDNGEGGEGWKGLTERELVEKARMAKELMGIQGLDSPEVKFISARKLKNGGVMYELNSTEAAEWLAMPDVRTSFLDKFGVGARVADRVYNIFVEFVPVGLGDDPTEGLEMIEGRNGLHPGELVSAKWARAPRARHENQKVAHLILSCATDRGANAIIRQGLIIEGKRVNARKLDYEPKRCLKCQRFGKGHIANECKQENDTCGMCAKAHRTRDCKENDPRAFCCINCKARGLRHDHPAVARTCPAFIEAKNRLTERAPEMKYRFYPRDQQWTWVRKDDNLLTTGGKNTMAAAVQSSGQGRLAGGRTGQGGGWPLGAGQMEDVNTKGGGEKWDRPTGRMQTTLDKYRWSSEPCSQTAGTEEEPTQQEGNWNNKQYSDFMALLETLAAQAWQLSLRSTQ